MVLAATRGCEIFEILSKDGTNVHGAGKGPVVQCHCVDQLWGLDVNPQNSKEFVTVGDDYTVRVWNRIERKQIRMVKLDCISRSVCYSPDGNYVAVGCGGDVEEVGRGYPSPSALCLAPTAVLTSPTLLLAQTRGLGLAPALLTSHHIRQLTDY